MPRSVEPRPLPQHRAKTVFLRVPSHAWPLVSTGRVTEFRAAIGNAPQLWRAPLPTFAVAYRRRLSKLEYDYRLILLEAVRQEALGTITDEGLLRAGYSGDDAFARFRRDWMIHEKKRFEPLRKVFVYTVRLIQQGDHERVGLALLDHLYGEYAQEAQQRPRSIQAQRGAARSARRNGGAVPAGSR